MALQGLRQGNSVKKLRIMNEVNILTGFAEVVSNCSPHPNIAQLSNPIIEELSTVSPMLSWAPL